MWPRDNSIKMDVDYVLDVASCTMLKYEAFSNPTLKHNYQVTSQKLVTTQQYLEETCKSFRDLEHRLADQEGRFQSQADHLANVNEENASLKSQLSCLADDLEVARKKALSADEENRCRTQELEARLSDLTQTEHELREKVMASEVGYSGRLKAGEQRERELQERIQKLDDEFEMLRIRTETREQELLSKLEVLSESRQETSLLAPTPLSNGSMSDKWHVEAESLRSVLDLKMTEVSELRRQNQDLRRSADELNLQQIRTSSLESKVEDLQFQLTGRIERETDLLAELKALSEKVSKEAKHRTRLSIHNEELQWKLKQNSERHQKTLQELSKSFQDKSYCQRSEDDQQYSSEEVTVSPPASPKIKGIVETSDSVSWILEMDDESPGQVASRAIRRVGSFRSSPTNALKRSKSSSQSQSMTNPLSQSASTTSIMRQFSAETSPMKGAGGLGVDVDAAGRTRSKSMSVKPTVDRSRRVQSLAPPPPIKASSKAAAAADLLDTSFQMPIHSSSPYKYENGSSGGGAVEMAAEKRRSSIKNLSFSRSRAASCGGGGSVAQPIPTMAKEVLPQESAGEAMILHISDGEDILSQNSSLTASTSSNSSSSADEETTAEKERTAISIHQQKSRGEDEQMLQEMVYASLHGSSGNNNSGSSKSGRCGGGFSGEEQQQQQPKWSPTRLMADVAMEEGDEEEDDDVFGIHSESVV